MQSCLWYFHVLTDIVPISSVNINKKYILNYNNTFVVPTLFFFFFVQRYNVYLQQLRDLINDYFFAIVPVQVNISMPKTTFTIGSDLMIPCSVDGYPTPSVAWYKDGQILRNNERTQINGKCKIDAKMRFSYHAPQSDITRLLFI